MPHHLIKTIFLLSLITVIPKTASAYAVKITDLINTPIKDVIVALVPEMPVADNAQIRQTEIHQIDYMFEPRIKVIQTNTTVNFPNYDPIHHNIYSFSETKKFSISLYKEERPQILFDTEGVVTLACNIHDWMLGYVIAVDTPYYGITGDNGIAHISNLPEGEYSLKYWHPSIPPSEGIQTYPHEINTAIHKFSVVPLNVNNKIIWPQKPETLLQQTTNKHKSDSSQSRGQPVKTTQQQKNKKSNSSNVIPLNSDYKY